MSRGIALIITEFTLVNFGLWFDIHFSVFLFDVIATIGFGFIILSLLLKASALELDAQKAKNNLYIIVAAVSLSLLSIIGVLFISRQKTLREL